MSASGHTFRLPPQVIVLDLLGTLLLLAGAFDLAGAHLLGPISDAVRGYGAFLVAAGVGMMIIGAIILVTRLLASRRERPGDAVSVQSSTIIRTVERRAR